MAIKRCPYCKAIIDEDDKYCDNCGTQLLFPEDEFVEEEIPGDKIVDEEEPEEETTEEEATEEQELEGELEDEEEFLEDGEEGREEEVEERVEDEESESVTPEREFDADEEEPEVRRTGEVEEAAETDESDAERAELEKETGPGEPEPEPELSDKEREEEEVEEEEEEFQAPDLTTAEGPVEPCSPPSESASLEEPLPPAKEIEARESRAEEPQRADEPKRPVERKRESDKLYEVSLEDDDLVFKTKKLDGTIDEIIRARKPVPDTESLPPWAHRIRETPATVEPDEEPREEPSETRREWTTDSGIGIPERVTQGTLPFADTRGPAAPTFGQEKDHVEEGTQDVTTEGLEAGRPGSLTLKLRAKLVDWVFVTVLWAISLYFTAQVLGVSFFRLLFGSPVPVLVFYVILLGLYFFLFLYFLGETLGDHYFSE